MPGEACFAKGERPSGALWYARDRKAMMDSPSEYRWPAVLVPERYGLEQGRMRQAWSFPMFEKSQEEQVMQFEHCWVS